MYLLPDDNRDLSHGDVAGDRHAFAIVPGIGPRTGSVKFFNLATDSSLMVTAQGWMGCLAGDYLDHYFDIVEEDGGERFMLQNHETGLRIFSNADGRLGCYTGQVFEDQYFVCEDREGRTVPLRSVHGCYGLQDSGFRMEGVGEPTVYTDAFHAGHYIFNAELSELWELREKAGVQPLLAWGAADDLRLPEMERPHAWAVENIPLLRRLEEAGIIAVERDGNEVYPARDFSDVRYEGAGLPPSNAVRFALTPVSGGSEVPFEKDWLRAWHGPSLHSLEGIAREGLRSDRKGRIFLSPSFQYPFCLYSVPDLLVGGARLRLVVEVRVRPDSYWEHGDHYQFYAPQHVERCVPEDCLEWEVVDRTDVVQVVGLVLKQLRPDHPTLRHDTNVRHAGQALLHL